MSEVQFAKTNRMMDLVKSFDKDAFKSLTKEMSLSEYIDLVVQNPMLARTAYQRLYDMIMSYGTVPVTRYKKTYTWYKFFGDSSVGSPIFGLEEPLDELVQIIRGGAGGYGTERRLILLRGPVGSAKSSICSLLKSGLEKYTKTDAGQIYTYKWVGLDKVPGLNFTATDNCPMHDDPLKLLPEDLRLKLETELNDSLKSQYDKACKQYRLEGKDPRELPIPHKISLRSGLNPKCQYYWDHLMEAYAGDWEQVVTNHIRVHRFQFSESKRIGIGTFQPKDEKNQDSTELSGDINYMLLSKYGNDSDPRAFSYDGEFQVAHRGMCEFIEILKLAKEFLYDVLGATQERKIKPKKFAQMDIDEVLISHSNQPEYDKMQSDKTMEALRDRTIVINVPYQLEWSKELKILSRDYGDGKVPQHIAPHTLEIAALWGVTTRLTPDPDNQIGKVDKAKLYDGRSLPNWTEESVKEMRSRFKNEGLERGISPRFVQNAISNCLVKSRKYINPFMVLSEIEEKLKTCSTVTDEQAREDYAKDLLLVKKELEEILKNEVQRAIVGSDAAIVALFTSYIDNVFAYIDGTKVKNPYTQDDMEPDEKLMRSIEEKIDVPESQVDDYRRSIAGHVGRAAKEGKKFEWNTNARLSRALEKKLFEETRETVNISKLGKGAHVANPEIQERIDAVKSRLIKEYGYNDESAQDVIEFVSGIFSRGDVKQ